VQVLPGSNTLLSISVLTSRTFSCQWFFFGSPILWATTTNLALTNFSAFQAGVCSVAVWNEYGTNWASTILLVANSPAVSVDAAVMYGGSTTRVDSARITLTNTGTGRDIYYTLDGSDPDFMGYRYSAPFTNTTSAILRAIAYNAAYTEWGEAAPVQVLIWPTYPLVSGTPGGGSITRSPAPYTSPNRWLSNTVVTLTATPWAGWTFLRWTGDSTDTTNVTEVLLDRPKTVSASFGALLTLLTNGSGSVLVNPIADFYPYGSTAQFTALPAAGAYFFGWAGSATGFTNPLSFTFTNASPGITALFGALKPNQVSLTVLPSGNGSVRVNPAQNVYTNGATVTVTATPASNHFFAGWSGDAAGLLNPLALTLTISKAITANFTPSGGANPPVITQQPVGITVGAGGSTALSVQVTSTGPVTYQWRFNGTAIPGANGPTLLLADMTAAQAGLYDVVITSPGGVVISAAAAVAQAGMQFLPVVVVDGAPGTSYRIEYSDEVQPVNWTLLAPVTLATNHLAYADETSTNRARRFYRVVPP